jgi:hypothetical protein
MNEPIYHKPLASSTVIRENQYAFSLIRVWLITTIENSDVSFALRKSVHFCPGAGGGDEWNTPGCDPTTNLIISGAVDWCDTVTLFLNEQVNCERSRGDPNRSFSNKHSRLA